MPSRVETEGVSHLSRTIIHSIPPKTNHTHTIIFLHSREIDGSGPELARELFREHASDGRNLQEILPSIKWVFPNAGKRDWTRGDTDDSEWFDMWDIRKPQERKDLQIDGLRESTELVLDIIRDEASFVPPERIILGGISQGGATAIHALLYGGIRLGGFIGMSSWLPFQDDIEVKARYSASNFTLLQNIRKLFTPANSKPAMTMPLSLRDSFPNAESVFKTPIFLSHSKNDDVVPYSYGDMLCWRLEEVLGFDVDWRAYEDGGHWLKDAQGVDDITQFLGRAMQV